MIENIKLTTRTDSGSLIRVAAKIERRDGRIWFVESPYSLKDEIKAMRGSRWHGYDEENPQKMWSVEDCQRNRFQLAYLMGEKVFAHFDQPLVRHQYTRPLMPHQCDLADAGLTYHYQIFAAEMGCVDGEAIVHINRAGRGFKLTLAELWRKFHGGQDRGRAWDRSIPTYIRSLCGETLRLNRVLNVLAKGRQPVVRLTLASGRSVRVTPDHEICVGYGQFRAAEQLRTGDTVLANDVKVDKDGYVRVHGIRHHHRKSTHGVYEHILVAEQMLGRPIGRDEVVHHKNGIKHDNRPANLEVLAGGNREHATLHARAGGFRRLDGGRGGRGGLVHFVPRFDTVISVEPDGDADVFDVVCADPYRNFVANGVAAHNCGKTLAAQEVMERSGVDLWWWVGPKTSLPNIRRELRKWHFPFDKIQVEFFTYEGLKTVVDHWDGSQPLPRGFICDESSRCKNAEAQRSKACQKLADMIREKYGLEGYVIEMSGTPSPKTPVDWWSQSEIAWPGFLKEGSPKAMEQRLAFMVDQTYESVGTFKKRIGWKDDERKCNKCGKLREEGPHDPNNFDEGYHSYEPSKNEASLLYQRLKGLAIVKHKKDCLNLPEKRYRKIVCKPTPSTLRVAQALVDSVVNAVTGMTLLRELSDGFQYREVKDGVTRCTHCADGTVDEWVDPSDPERVYRAVDLMDPEFVATLVRQTAPCPACGGTREVPKITRVSNEVPCPKDAALRMLLEENEEVGRLVVFAGFTGSVDRIVRLCLAQGWDVVRCDQGEFQVFSTDQESDEDTAEEPLDYWANMEHPKVAFVANPESGGMSLTLVEARTAVYWSNSWKPEYRVQSEDRIHRKGMDENLGCTIVDLIHLPSDERVLEVIRANRRLELMTLGEVLEGVDWNDTGNGELQVEEAVT